MLHKTFQKQLKSTILLYKSGHKKSRTEYSICCRHFPVMWVSWIFNTTDCNPRGKLDTLLVICRSVAVVFQSGDLLLCCWFMATVTVCIYRFITAWNIKAPSYIAKCKTDSSRVADQYTAVSGQSAMVNYSIASYCILHMGTIIAPKSLPFGELAE